MKRDELVQALALDVERTLQNIDAYVDAERERLAQAIAAKRSAPDLHPAAIAAYGLAEALIREGGDE